MAKEKARAQLKASLLAKKASTTPEASSKAASSDSEHSNAYTGPASGVEETKASQNMKTPENDAGPTRRHKNGKTKSDTKDGKHKKGRRKEERRERRNERRKKKDESRKARKET
jgi:exosome complex protein LRP1